MHPDRQHRVGDLAAQLSLFGDASPTHALCAQPHSRAGWARSPDTTSSTDGSVAVLAPNRLPLSLYG
eukprot:3491683-Pyramimonas_sp.AAC.1